MAAEEPSKLVFVNQSATSTQQALQQNRRMIRRQARLHTLSKWKNNRLQSLEVQLVNGVELSGPPDDVLEVQPVKRRSKVKRDTETSNVPSLKQKSSTRYETELPAIRRELALKGYEKARSRFNLDISWLSALAIEHAERVAVDKDAPVQCLQVPTMVDWLALREKSFLDLVPPYYDQSPLVKSLVDAVLIKMQHMLSDPYRAEVSESMVLNAYGKALRSLQDALADRETMLAPETLCAIQLLQLYEMLHASKTEVWIAHTKGTQKLFQIRGPWSYATKLEKSLLCTQLQHIVSRAFLQNTDCFLEQPEWQDLLETIGEEDDVTCHPIYFSLWRAMAFLPRLQRETGEFLLSPDTKLDREILLLQLRHLKQKLGAWRAVYFSSSNHPELGPLPWHGLACVSILYDSIVNRLLIALRPSAEDAFELEKETQFIADTLMVHRTDEIITTGYRIGLIIKATRLDWMAVTRNDSRVVDKERDLIRKNVYMRWNAMMGRTGAKDVSS